MSDTQSKYKSFSLSYSDARRRDKVGSQIMLCVLCVEVISTCQWNEDDACWCEVEFVWRFSRCGWGDVGMCDAYNSEEERASKTNQFPPTCGRHSVSVLIIQQADYSPRLLLYLSCQPVTIGQKNKLLMRVPDDLMGVWWELCQNTTSYSQDKQCSGCVSTCRGRHSIFSGLEVLFLTDS